MNHIDAKLPPVINRYFEQFVGGGSVLFHIAEKYQENIKQYFINDKDANMMNLYSAIRDNKKELLDELQELNTIRDKESFQKFLAIFNHDELNTTKRSALYLYLLKLSFNNNLKHKKETIATFLQQVNISNLDYTAFFKQFEYEQDDFVFLDPPYNVASVREYYSSIFDETDYNELLAVCDDLHKKGINWMLTLDANETHKKLFANYDRHSFISNGKNKDKEIIITDY
ncbi:S-adenosyl-L-methionine-dependent methyltransferase [Phlyctochytrium arcticum]|nr:S-adenosyl-L-methionine-dependent methyltransferase [Phlyctochytrium arcticum]